MIMERRSFRIGRENRTGGRELVIPKNEEINASVQGIKLPAAARPWALESSKTWA
jgi:hypothetical protein